jgi:serine/threonine protein kinase
LPQRQVAALVRRLALALEEAHRRQVVHRDLKPANIMMTRRGEPVIMDFGLARRCSSDDPRLTQAGDVMGTPAYMAPEQARGNPDEVGPACDIYSLGVILYELLCKRLPFTGDAMAILTQALLDEPPSLSTHRPDLDPRLEAICHKAMAKKPEARYRSMADFAVALTEYLKAASQTTAGDTEQNAPAPALLPSVGEAPDTEKRLPPPPTETRRAEALRKRPGWGWVALTAVALVLLAAGGGAWFAFQNGLLKLGTSTPPIPDDHQASRPNPVEPKGVAELPSSRESSYVWPAEALRDGKIAAPSLAKIKPWFQDSFGNPQSGFPQFKGEAGEKGYRNGKYFIQSFKRGGAGALVPLGRATPPNPSGDFACQVTARVNEPPASWGLGIADREDGKVLRVRIRISNVGRLRTWMGQDEDGDSPDAPEREMVVHPAIKKGAQAFNTLLVVVQGRHAEIYVNAVAVCDPLFLEREMHVPHLTLFCISTAKGATAEFENVTVWPARSIPPLEKRGAIPKKK